MGKTPLKPETKKLQKLTKKQGGCALGCAVGCAKLCKKTLRKKRLFPYLFPKNQNTMFKVPLNSTPENRDKSINN